MRNIADSSKEVYWDSEKVKEGGRPRTSDIQDKGESIEVGVTELELEAQSVRDMRQDAEMCGSTERERCSHK